MKYYYFINHTPCKCNKKKSGQIEITELQYNAYVDAISNFCLIPPNGQYYRLEEDCSWSLYDLPEPVVLEDAATEEDYQNALSELGVEL